ncbi:MAG: hypothetical protein NTX25_20440, partial [Proteobacteria bacterium]|nr:hypothetical protein [Pseudomonadota bacterium]
MEQDIRLVYAAASTQVRISFPLEAVRYDRRPPKDLYKRAKAKLEDELSKGHLEVYDLYEESFATYWSYLRDQHIDDKTVVNFVLAQGFRLYKEIAVRQNPANKEWLLSINASAEHLQKITWPRFAGYIMRQIGIQPYSSPSLQARILEAWHRGLRGEKLKDRPLSAMAVELSDSPSRYAHDKVHGSVFLWIADAKLIQSLADLKTLGIRIQSFLEKNSAVLSGYDTLLKESLEILREMAGMPEVMGFGLPLGLPVALKVIVAAAPEAKNQSHAGKDAQPIGEKKPAL